jgi:hypothetical protein
MTIQDLTNNFDSSCEIINVKDYRPVRTVVRRPETNQIALVFFEEGENVSITESSTHDS